MPAKLDRCVKKLKRKGIEESRAWAICTAAMKKDKKKKGKK